MPASAGFFRSWAGFMDFWGCSERTVVLETQQGVVLSRMATGSGTRISPRIRPTSKTRTTADVVIPEKLYFRIGEVAELCRLPAYVLRFWETEFPQLKPVKSSTGQRMYRHKDVESVLHIKKLLYEEGFTIAGARQQLRAENKGGDKKQNPLPFPERPASQLKPIREGLREILGIVTARH